MAPALLVERRPLEFDANPLNINVFTHPTSTNEYLLSFDCGILFNEYCHVVAPEVLIRGEDGAQELVSDRSSSRPELRLLRHVGAPKTTASAPSQPCCRCPTPCTRHGEGR
jgi:hypothetical protein